MVSWHFGARLLPKELLLRRPLNYKVLLESAANVIVFSASLKYLQIDVDNKASFRYRDGKSAADRSVLPRTLAGAFLIPQLCRWALISSNRCLNGVG